MAQNICASSAAKYRSEAYTYKFDESSRLPNFFWMLAYNERANYAFHLNICDVVDVVFKDMPFRLGLLLCMTICLFMLVRSEDDFQKRCLSFTPERYVSNSTRKFLDYVPAGTNLTFPGNDATCARPSQLVSADLCRVALSIPTSNRSSIIFEMWLPVHWSGRFLGTGNGGIDGCEYDILSFKHNMVATYPIKTIIDRIL